jgi:hypothetical protein
LVLAVRQAQMVMTQFFLQLLQQVVAKVGLLLMGHRVGRVVVAVMQALLVVLVQPIKVLRAVTVIAIRLLVVVVVVVQVRLAQMRLLVVAMVEMAKQAI